MNLRKLCLITFVVLLVCQLGFAQMAVDRTIAGKAIAAAKASSQPVPVVPAWSARGKIRPTIWVAGQALAKSAKPSSVTGEPSFCDYGNGYFQVFCAKGVQTAYGTNQILNANGGAGTVIAIVDFFSYSLAEATLAQFDSDMHLPACTTANGCFTSVALTTIDATGTGWDLESMLDLEYAHAMAPNAKIVYVQGDPYGDPGYYAVSIAALGCPASPYCSLYGITSSPAADIVSNSWTYTYGPVYSDDPYYNLGKVLLFASGDASAFPAYAVESYPCTATTVTCVGGTSLYTTNTLQRTLETGWAGAGGGCSAGEAIPAWQGPVGSGVCSPNRAAPDVAAVADGNTGVGAYINNAYWGNYYYRVGGTSVATPITAGLVADMDTARVSFGKAKFTFLNTGLYKAAGSNYAYFYYDITSGFNGYNAGPGFDMITGLGNITGKDLANRFYGLP